MLAIPQPGLTRTRGVPPPPTSSAHISPPETGIISSICPDLSRAHQVEDPPATSYDHSSLLIPTEGCAGPPARWAAERCPCPNAGECTQAWNASSSRHRVTTSQVVRPSV